MIWSQSSIGASDSSAPASKTRLPDPSLVAPHITRGPSSDRARSGRSERGARGHWRACRWGRAESAESQSLGPEHHLRVQAMFAFGELEEFERSALGLAGPSGETLSEVA